MSTFAKLHQTKGLLLASAGLLAACGSNDIGSSGDYYDTTNDTSWDVYQDTSSDGWGGADIGVPDSNSGSDASQPSTDTVDETPDTYVPGPDLGDGFTYEGQQGWVLSRPIGVRSDNQGRVVIGQVVSKGEGARYVALRAGSGSIEIDNRVYNATDAYAHAGIARFEEGDQGQSKITGFAYVDGPIDSPDMPLLTICEDAVYATVNEAGRQKARAVKLSLDLERITVLTITANAELGASVKLGQPVCGGPNVVFTLDAVGGARFALPSGQEGSFSPEQTKDRSLIVNGRVFDNQAPSVVSANGMQILGLYRGEGQKIVYHTEANIERSLGGSQIVPGDQLVYVHDYAVAEGQLAISQGFFGAQDIQAMAVSPTGQIAVIWTEPTDTGAINYALGVFSNTGARIKVLRHADWRPSALSWDENGQLHVAGTFLSLEVFGMTRVALGAQDAFLARLNPELELNQISYKGVANRQALLVSTIGVAQGSQSCPGRLETVGVHFENELAVLAVSERSACVSHTLEMTEPIFTMASMQPTREGGQTVFASSTSLGLRSPPAEWPANYALWGFAETTFKPL